MLKAIIKALLEVTLLFQVASAQVFDSLYDALPQAQQQDKLVVFFILSHTCPHCHEYIRDIDSNKKLTHFLDEHFIVAMADLAQGGKVPFDLPFTGMTPTTLILTPGGQVVGEPIRGRIPSNHLMDYLDAIERLRKSYARGSE